MENKFKAPENGTISKVTMAFAGNDNADSYRTYVSKEPVKVEAGKDYLVIANDDGTFEIKESAWLPKGYWAFFS